MHGPKTVRRWKGVCIIIKGGKKVEDAIENNRKIECGNFFEATRGMIGLLYYIHTLSSFFAGFEMQIYSIILILTPTLGNETKKTYE